MTEAAEAKLIRAPCILAAFGQLVLFGGGALTLIFLAAPESWIALAACAVFGVAAHVPLVRADGRLVAERDRKEAEWRQSGIDWS